MIVRIPDNLWTASSLDEAAFLNPFIPGYSTSAFIAVFLHEGAHLVTAIALGVKVKRVGLSWRGPYILREAGTPVENTAISLAGPGMNLLLCLLCFYPSPVFAFVNGFLALFNLLPFVPSSDGQRVYRLWSKRSVTPV